MHDTNNKKQRHPSKSKGGSLVESDEAKYLSVVSECAVHVVGVFISVILVRTFIYSNWIIFNDQGPFLNPKFAE